MNTKMIKKIMMVVKKKLINGKKTNKIHIFKKAAFNLLDLQFYLFLILIITESKFK